MRRRVHVPPRAAWEVDRTGVNWGPVGHPDISAETQAYQQQLERVRRLGTDDLDELEQAEQDLLKARAAMETAWLAAKPVVASTSSLPNDVFWAILATALLKKLRVMGLPVFWAITLRRHR